MKYTLFFIVKLIALPYLILGQCDLTLSGYVLDESTGIPMADAVIHLEDSDPVVADSIGYFKFTSLCSSACHIRISHIGCEDVSQFVQLKKDTTLYLLLHHHAELLSEVVIHGDRGDFSATTSNTIGKTEIAARSKDDLAEITESIAGVDILKSGSGVSKPIIHGLSGNRITILNNGIAQAGQQWGNDHAPEIDPSTADHISVIKGVSSLAFGGTGLGGAILIESGPINKDPHLHGAVNYIFQHNGIGHTLNAALENSNPYFDWRVSGTFKKNGDSQTPDYYLTNTGKTEINGALQLEKRFNKHWKASLYLSSFNTEIGILRGSHIGNLPDLEMAILRKKPLFTKDQFSYSVVAPRQEVAHQLLKMEVDYMINDNQNLTFVSATQLNDRKEFDVRRGGRSILPALSLLQFTQFVEAKYLHHFGGEVLLKTGLQLSLIDNTNIPETNILPLIPDYTTFNPSAYLILKKEWNRLLLEVGGRYDLKSQQVLAISNTFPRKIERFSNVFNNYGLSAGMKYQLGAFVSSNLNVGYATRNPEINELYSNGLHQGVSGIEEGQKGLKIERSLKSSLSLDFNIKQKLFIQFLTYHQQISDFIYLQPQNEFRLTIRGAFPVFYYEQTDAQLLGADLLVSYEPIQQLKIIAQYATVRGRDIVNNLPLIYMPSDNMSSKLTWFFKDGKRLKKPFISVNGKYVFRQNQLHPEQDFLAAPDAYFLIGGLVGTKFQLKEATLDVSFGVENALNHRYRDYLNRQRYYADETGINIYGRVNFKF